MVIVQVLPREYQGVVTMKGPRTMDSERGVGHVDMSVEQRGEHGGKKWGYVDGMQILPVNELRVYRDVIGDAFRVLRPHHDVVTVASEDIDDAVRRLDPSAAVSPRPCRHAYAPGLCSTRMASPR
jgi:hypothetical protein